MNKDVEISDIFEASKQVKEGLVYAGDLKDILENRDKGASKNNQHIKHHIAKKTKF